VITTRIDDESRAERISRLIAVLVAEGENSIARADALGALITEFSSSMYSLAYRILGNVEDTKDVVAEVTAKFVFKFDVSRAVGAANPAAAIGAFLRTTTRRTALDVVRLRMRVAPLPEFEDSVEASFGLSDLDGTLLRDAVAELESAHRDVVLLRYFLDLTLVEVAAALGVSLTTVKNRLRSALAELKQVLDDGDSTHGSALSA
jgi:RNA polymerase sigma-70 factor (ECF subfamily)